MKRIGLPLIVLAWCVVGCTGPLGGRDCREAEQRLFRVTQDSERIQRMVFRSVDFENLTPDQALEWLVKESQKIDPRGVGVELIFEKIPAGRSISNLTVHLRDRPLLDVLGYIIRPNGWNYRLEGNVIRLVNASCWGVDDWPMVCRAYRVSRLVFNGTLPDGTKVQDNVKEFLLDAGVPFPSRSFVRYTPDSQILVVRNTAENLEIMEAVIRLLGSQEGK